MKDIEELLSLAVYCRDRVNPYLFNYCLTVALLHREETRDLDLPSFVRCFPDKYVDARVFTTAREDANILPDGSRVSALYLKDLRTRVLALTSTSVIICYSIK